MNKQGRTKIVRLVRCFPLKLLTGFPAPPRRNIYILRYVIFKTPVPQLSFSLASLGRHKYAILPT